MMKTKMLSPVQQASRDIERYDTQLDILNANLVMEIKLQLWREKLARGESVDNEAKMYLHVMAHWWGTEQHMSETRRLIVDIIELKTGAVIYRRKVVDAIHCSMHDVLGECMYQTDEYYDEETGKYEPILSQPCSIWK